MAALTEPPFIDQTNLINLLAQQNQFINIIDGNDHCIYYKSYRKHTDPLLKPENQKQSQVGDHKYHRQ